MSKQTLSLAKTTLAYDYGSYTYEIEFKSDDTLHWKCTGGEEKGKEADETYRTQQLGDQRLFLSWIEADGLGVSQVVDLGNMTIHCYLKMDEEIVPLSGTIERL